ncbi:MAG TPA: 2-amino-4-oxopentanoate thiolase subunit OrtA [Clostridia bacterium]|nr:2-amino-4-oxopentanoate thiolase subunit OrtA [Clostridia bacterium]
MNKVAKKGDWVRIEEIILTPDQRLESLPESTRKVSLKCWMNGFLEDESATVGDVVTIRSNIDRKISGKLFEIWPKYDHSFGRQQPTLINIGHELREIMK